MLMNGREQKRALIVVIQIFFIILTVTFILILNACSKQEISIKDNSSTSSTNDIETSDTVIKLDNKIKKSDLEEINTASFVKYSLQDGFFLSLDDKIVTTILSGMTFKGQTKDGKYQFYETIGDYLGLDGFFNTNRVFTYGNKVIYQWTTSLNLIDLRTRTFMLHILIIIIVPLMLLMYMIKSLQQETLCKMQSIL